ncbi:MAG: DUF1521 domain-containing protein [Deltaproteobacteria bacterium]|nr:DUF1521 domain-containing protein [Deltaproteobacteria bacterium]
MSSDRVSSSPNVANVSTSNSQANQAPRALSAAQMERFQIEAQAGVRMLENGARMIKGMSATQGSGDDGLTRPRPGNAATVVPPPNTVAPPASTSPTTPTTPTKPPDGLKVGGIPGFPDNAVRTPGGYTIVPTGQDATWKIYGPGQEFGDDAETKIWGDPHVNEKDGTRWDFTKDSNFALPDGTVIRADTTSEVGHSMTQALTIVSGTDKVEVSGVNTGRPQVGQPTHDAEQWMNDNAATLQAGATFSLRSDGKNVDWFRSTNGQLEGIITGSRENFDGKKSYDQIIGGGGKAVAQQSSGGTGNVDMDKALALNGLLALGGMGFLGNGADVQSFMSQVQTALADLLKQDDLKELLKVKTAVRRL